MYKAGILTVSDKCSQGERKDRSGKLICQTCLVLSHALAKLKGNPTECGED